MSSFKWKSGSIFQMDSRNGKLSEFMFYTELFLDDAVERQNHMLAFGFEAESFTKQNNNW